MKVKKTYRIEEKILDKLDKWADEHNVNQTEAIETAIQKLAEEPDEMPDSSHTNAGILEVLSDQLKAKDQQIEELQRLLDQEQKLHLSAMMRLEEPKRKKSLWRKLWGEDPEDS